MLRSSACRCQGGGRCGVTVSSFWYGKRGNKFCASHRAAWNRFRKGGETQEDDEEPSVLTEMDELLGTRYCEPVKMKRKERYNEVEKNELQFCVQGTFNFEEDARGHTDTRWQTLGKRPSNAMLYLPTLQSQGGRRRQCD